MRLPGHSRNIKNYSSHIPAVIMTFYRTQGNVLELGSGIFSTPMLHHLCTFNKRTLVSFENDLPLYSIFTQFENDYHRIYYVENWDETDIEKKWDFSFIDHSPAQRRVVDIERLANYSNIILIHDSNVKHNRIYHYDTIYPLFKYKYTFTHEGPQTTALSNFIDLKEFYNVD